MADDAPHHEQVVRRTGTFGGTSLAYEARLGEMIVPDEAGEPGARYVYVSYSRVPTETDSRRPVVFAFNGGPGSSTVWTHLGWLGPYRVADSDTLEPRSVPPFNLVENPDAPLDVADVVLIDPPGTGWSRLLATDKAGWFYSTRGDAVATLRFIATWCRQHQREESPKFLLGESYGTVRAAVMAGMSLGGPTATGRTEVLALHGVVLVGPALLHDQGVSDDLRLVTSLPNLAATARFHGRAGRSNVSLVEHVQDVRAFAAGEYLPALFSGHRLDRADRDLLVARLSGFTGLSSTVLERENLRPSSTLFAHELLADRSREVGLYDSRFTWPLLPQGVDPVADDPAMGQYVPAFAGAIIPYLRSLFESVPDDDYEAINFAAVNSRWDWGHGPGEAPDANYAEDLARALRRNPRLEVMVMGGYYDLVTPIDVAAYALSRYPVDPTRVHWREYPSGHAGYLGAGPRRAMSEDLRAFVTRLTSR